VFARRLCAAQGGSATSCDRSPPDFEPVGEVDGVTRGIDGTDANRVASSRWQDHEPPAIADARLCRALQARVGKLADQARVRLKIEKVTRMAMLSKVHGAPLATDAAWYRSGMFNEHYRPAGIDHYLLTYRYVPELGLIHYVVLFKDLRASRFTERDRTIAHYVHRELGETWKAARKAVLPRRLRQTLDWLERGASEKEVADRLGVGPQTVHTYCKLLHKRFGVRSRGELLAHARMRPRAPRLVLEDANI
jgi:DNA-binding CsgD family transcriptional regulator